eukprot:XP_001692704.1 predicted protein [Chlamydomonas reinhardtii]
MYNFTDSKEERVPGQRRNRGFQKKQERNLMSIVVGLANMSAKQLGAVSHLLPPGTVEAIGIAAKLPRSNQVRCTRGPGGRGAGVLGSREPESPQLQAAVALAEDNAGVWDDGDVSGRVLAWREGLLAGDEAVAAEVYGYPRAWAPDHQQLRAAVRQCQLAMEEEAKAAIASAPDASPGSSNDADDEEEDLTAVLAAAAARSRRGSGSSTGAAAPPKSRALLKSLTKMLKPLAMRVVAEADAKGASGADSDEAGEEEVA